MAAPRGFRFLTTSRLSPRISDIPYTSLFYRRSSTNNSTPVLRQQVFLDTHAVVTALETNGFSRSQSECISSILLAMTTKETEMIQQNYVTNNNQEVTVQRMMSLMDGLKKDMLILEKTEFTLLRNESEKLAQQVSQLKDQLRDEIQKLDNKVTLDINLERSRAKEQNALAIQEVNQCKQLIKTESANMLAKLEASKTDVLKYFAATLLGCVTLSLGAFRILKS